MSRSPEYTHRLSFPPLCSQNRRKSWWNSYKHQNFRSRQWGSSLLGPRTLDPWLSPPSTWVDIFWYTFLKSHLQTSLPTDKNSYPKTTFEEEKIKKFQTTPGESQFFLLVNISFSLEYKPSVKFQNYNCPSSNIFNNKNKIFKWNISATPDPVFLKI